MPNTLAHIGVQGLATRSLIPGADLKWIYVGAVVPDVPWIAQRVARAALPEISAYDLRLYAIVQSSLFMCLILSGALSSFSIRPRRVFVILALGSVLHLLLDALQTKWANGVHLFAPFSWKLLNFGLFWPEAYPTLLLTALGLVFFLYAWWRIPAAGDDVLRPRGRSLIMCALFFVGYLLLPLAFLSGPEAADNHSVGTLRATEARPGRAVEFDRIAYEHRGGGDMLHTFAGEDLAVAGLRQERSGTVSVRGRFLDRRTVLIEDLHWHWPFARDAAVFLGLTLTLLYWIRSLRPSLFGRPLWPRKT